MAPEHFIATIQAHFKSCAHLTGIDQLPPNIETVFHQTDRRAFVPLVLQDRAWDDQPLPIEQGQTISQPFIVALMTVLADIQPTDHVLEIGTGSGYQTAILAQLAAQVHTFEIYDQLSYLAQRRLSQHPNIQYHLSQGDCCVNPAQQFQVIVVTCCAKQLPNVLVDQLAPTGRLIIPLTTKNGQMLFCITHDPHTHQLHKKPIIPVRFVPMQ